MRPMTRARNVVWLAIEYTACAVPVVLMVICIPFMSVADWAAQRRRSE